MKKNPNTFSNRYPSDFNYFIVNTIHDQMTNIPRAEVPISKLYSSFIQTLFS